MAENVLAVFRPGLLVILTSNSPSVEYDGIRYPIMLTESTVLYFNILLIVLCYLYYIMLKIRLV